MSTFQTSKGALEGQGREVADSAAGSSGRWKLQLTIARLAFDSAVIVAATVVSFVARFGIGWLRVSETGRFDLGSHLTASIVWLGALLGAMAVNRLYDDDTLFPGGGELPRVLRSVVEAVALLSVFVYFTHSFNVSRSWFALTAILTAVLLGAERAALRTMLRRERRHGRFRRPVLLVSKGEDQRLRVTVNAVPDFQIERTIGPNELAEALEGDGPDLIVASGDFDDAELWRMVIDAGQSGRSVFLHSQMRSVSRDRLDVREVGERALIKVAPPFLTGGRAFRKRSFDLVVGFSLFLVLLPVMGVIAIATLLTSGPPVLFGQERGGKGGTGFRMWKFRTMRRDAEGEAGPRWTSENDPRRTRLGRFLRRTSMDELPQLWNVIAGDMSLVGPRPLSSAETEQPEFSQRFATAAEWYMYRYRIRPGITGWAQIHGLRGHTPLDPWIDHDNWYIENWSLSLDIKILMQTLAEVIRGRNAY